MAPSYVAHFVRLVIFISICSGASSKLGKCFRFKYGPLPDCPYPPPGLGDFQVDITARPISQSSQLHNDVISGGRWRPPHCHSVQKVAILVPYRDRLEDLKVFLPNIHSFLKKQLLDYRVYVIEQGDDKHWNKGVLFNAGFLESLKDDQFDCFILQDVDKFPEDTRNLYTCSEKPTHLIGKMRYIGRDYRPRPYETYFGGVTSMLREHYLKINGFSNEFWGWGSEDDDHGNRVDYHKLEKARVPDHIGRYLEIYHPYGFVNPKRHEVTKDGWNRFHTDGLNNVSYNLTSILKEPLYTNITVRNLHQDPYCDH